MAYRAMYEQEVGPLASDSVLHHLCGTPLCIRIEHLEVTTQTEHLKEHWKQGWYKAQRKPESVRIA